MLDQHSHIEMEMIPAEKCGGKLSHPTWRTERKFLSLYFVARDSRVILFSKLQ